MPQRAQVPTHLPAELIYILVEIGTKKGRATKPTLKIGVCGEHGGDPKSIYFFHKAGLDYVSCSPYRVPAARLAAAHAALADAPAALPKNKK